MKTVMQRRLIAAFVLLAFGIFDAHAQGLIWSVTRTNTLGGTVGGAPDSDWYIAFDHVSDLFTPTPPSLNPVTSIFSQRLTTNDAGHTFFASALNEPRFVGFVAALTDGANGYIRFQAPAAFSWGVQSEVDYLRRSALAPDLAGYNITQIGFRVNNFFDWYYAPDDLNQKTLDYSLDFYGAPVPEPSTWALLTLGTAALLLRRKARPQPPAPPK